MRGLAYRHQLQRAKGRAFRYLRWLFGPRYITDKQIARYTVDRTPCSCSLCGNPRRFTGAVTVQEMRSGGSR